MPGKMAAGEESEGLVDDDHSAGSGEENIENSSPPNSPTSPPYSAPQSPASPPQSPYSAAQSPSSPPQSPLSGAHSPSSPPQSAPQSPSSPPQSPPQSPSSPLQSAPQSPSSPSSPAERHSEDEVQVSEAEAEAEASDDDGGANSQDEAKQGDDGGQSGEENDGESSEKEEKQQSAMEDSEPEENIPEINIESADEDEDQHSDKHGTSDIEMEQVAESEEEKDDHHNVNNESDDENKIDEEEAMSTSGQMQRSASPTSDNERPKSPSSSPMHEKPSDDLPSENEEKAKPKDKADSDAEENADSGSDAESDESEVGGLIADIFGESDDDEEFEGFNEEDIASGKVPKDSIVKAKKEKKKRSAKIMSESEDEADDKEEQDTEREEKEEADGIIEDLPAPAAEEEEDEEEEEQHKPVKPKKVESDDSDDDRDRKMREDFVSDFDLMMQKKKEESSKRRKRRDVDLISDSDDLIADIISQMRQAAEEDKDLNRRKKTATKKLKILPMVMSQLKKQDLKMAFLDQGVLNVIAEWMTPLPDRSLPHLNIREGMLKQLSDFPSFDQSLLKSSGIGRALMYLYKHPKETKENREKAGKLITEWARPIFNVTTNYHSLTKEEREQRDYDHVPKRRKVKDQDGSQDEEVPEKKDIEKELTGEQKSLRPGDKGWIARARVPMPSTKDYVNRPKWNIEMEFGRQSSKKPLTRIEKHMRMLQEKKRLSKTQRAITISIEGRKMAI